MPSTQPKPYRLKRDTIIAGKYRVLSHLGSGWEGEVHRVSEVRTGIERAAKLFYPERDPRGRVSAWYARKLDRLRGCAILIPYLTLEEVELRGQSVHMLVSELVTGEVLSRFLRRQPGGHLTVFEALVLLRQLVAGLETIHGLSDYHGDLHADNLFIQRHGIQFELRLIDCYRCSGSRRANMKDDVIDAIHLFYQTLGGQRRYSRQPQEVKSICLGLQRRRIKERYPSAAALREHLDTFEWNS